MESIAAIPRDTDYVRNPLSDWDTPLPVRDDEPIEPVPQQDLKLWMYKRRLQERVQSDHDGSESISLFRPCGIVIAGTQERRERGGCDSICGYRYKNENEPLHVDLPK